MKHIYRPVVLAFGLLFTIILLIMNSIFMPFTVSGHSMDSTLFNGEQLVGIRKYWTPIHIKTGVSLFTPQRGNIVIANADRPILGTNRYMHELIVKRVIGMPNEDVVVANNQVYINNKPFKEYYRKNGVTYSNNTGNVSSATPTYFLNQRMTKNNTVSGAPIEARLNDHQLWLMGDNRNYSGDSRILGAFNQNTDILAKIVPYNFPISYNALQWTLSILAAINIVLWVVAGWFQDKDRNTEKSMPDAF